jgi:hypothetical protein
MWLVSGICRELVFYIRIVFICPGSRNQKNIRSRILTWCEFRTLFPEVDDNSAAIEDIHSIIALLQDVLKADWPDKNEKTIVRKLVKTLQLRLTDYEKKRRPVTENGKAGGDPWTKRAEDRAFHPPGPPPTLKRKASEIESEQENSVWLFTRRLRSNNLDV